MIKALGHAALAANRKLKLTHISAADLEEETKESVSLSILMASSEHCFGFWSPNIPALGSRSAFHCNRERLFLKGTSRSWIMHHRLKILGVDLSAF